MERIHFCLLVAASLLFSSCGYHFQGRHNPLKNLGIHRIYVSQFKNATFRPGIEQLFSTAMIREIQKSRAFRLVNSEEEADAVLSGEVIGAEASITSTRSRTLSADKTVDVASEFAASVACSVLLRDKRGRAIFSQSIAASKAFPGATGIGDESATVSLVNDSEQRLAVQFLASQMMASVYQRMIDTF